MKRPIKVAAVAVIKDESNRVLLGFRKGKYMPNVWGLPGGKIEYGEDPKDTVVRETKEETNLDIKILEDLGWISSVIQDKHCITFYFKCQVCSSQPLTNMEPDKFNEWKWFHHNELTDLMHDQMYDILK